MNEIKKVIIPLSEFESGFLPLSKAVPKALWPLKNKSVIEYLVQEAKDSGLNDILFIEDSKTVLNYFKYDSKLKKILKENKDEQGLKNLEQLEQLTDGLGFSSVKHGKQIGHGSDILQASSKISKEECFAVMTTENIIISNIPCIQQLIDIHDTSQKSVIALKRINKENSNIRVQVDKIANRVFKIKKIGKDIDSDLAIVGRYILTPEVLEFLKGKDKLMDAFIDMLQTGKTIYGYEFEGTHLEIKNKESYIRSNNFLINEH